MSKEDARHMLRQLTGQDFGIDAKKWRAWWKAHMTPWGNPKRCPTKSKTKDAR